MCQMILKIGDREVGGIYATSWETEKGLKVTLHLSAEVAFIVAGRAMNIPWYTVRMAMYTGHGDRSMVAEVTIPEHFLPPGYVPNG